MFLAACSPAEYQVNPPSVEEQSTAIAEATGVDQSTEHDQSTQHDQQRTVTESAQKGYMRILGDLRWDKLRSPSDWETKFPGCLKPESKSYYLAHNARNTKSSTAPECLFSAGGIKLELDRVEFSNTPTAFDRDIYTKKIGLFVPSEKQGRAFGAAFTKKYNTTLNGDVCSKYTCINDPGRYNFVEPTPYTISILDQVKIDTSDL